MRLPTSRRTARFVGLVPSQLMAAPGLADGRCCCSAACGTLALLPLLSRRPPSLCVLASRRSELASSAPRWGEAVVEHEHTLHVEALGDVRHELVRGRRKGAVAVEELPTIRPGLSRAQQWSRVRWACTHQRVLGLEAQGFAQQCCHSLERSVGRDLELGRPQDGRVARVLEVDDHLPVLDGRGGRRHRSRSRRPPAARSASLSSLLLSLAPSFLACGPKPSRRLSPMGGAAELHSQGTVYAKADGRGGVSCAEAWLAHQARCAGGQLAAAMPQPRYASTAPYHPALHPNDQFAWRSLCAPTPRGGGASLPRQPASWGPGTLLTPSHTWAV